MVSLSNLKLHLCFFSCISQSLLLAEPKSFASARTFQCHKKQGLGHTTLGLILDTTIYQPDLRLMTSWQPAVNSSMLGSNLALPC